MKELIYLDENALSPAGGPLGVGYYIHEETSKDNDSSISFLKSDVAVKDREARQKRILYKFPHMTKIVRSLRHIKDYKTMLYSPKDNSDKLMGYDIVHFHSTKDMYSQRKSLEKFKGKTVLTSHSPIPLFQELYAACATNFERRFYEKRMKDFEEMDKWSFLNADYIIFPCPDAEEPYFNNWKAYSEIKKTRSDSYRYVLTGISERKSKVSKEDIRKKYEISSESFVVVYVGRHNEVKGYGNLKKIGEDLLGSNNDIQFLIAGKEAPLTRLHHDSWTEVGFTKDPYSLIAAGDVFILPNNETYFDLVFIEVLSLGKIIIASRTGGNRYYEKAGVKGVFLYDTLDEAEQLIEKIKKMPIEDRIDLERANKEFYKKNLTSRIFYENYKKTIDSL